MDKPQSPTDFSPKSMMKSWRPEKFSDTEHSSRQILSRTILEYHLDTLTSRNQETEFERFALAVARATVCPNLRPQTGPAGGGDGKVDTETIPVADQLTYSWIVGEANTTAASERWGFAFSAKKRWKDKLKSDIAKIAETNRGYGKAFFISNQLISDRNTSELQDALSKEHGMDVRILGRNWLMDQVYEKKLELKAIDLLGIDVGEQIEPKLGPLDASRTDLLAQLDKQIETEVEEGNFSPDIVNACLNSSRLSRELELPRADVEGRYARSQRLAEKCGTPQQKLEVAYQRAWTAHFWHEDFELFDRLYTEVEKLAQNSDSPFHLERLSNLWHIAFTLSRLKVDAVGAETISARTITLADALTRISQSMERPSSALHARSLLLIQQISSTAPNTPGTVFRELRDVVSQCDGLPGFPLDSLTQVIEKMGMIIDDEPEYDKLLEEVISLTSKHEGEAVAAIMILRRGAQMLEKKRHYDSIALIGRALHGLAKHETRKQLISGLNLLSHAYEQVGLFWAARGALLSSISMIVGEFENFADTDRLHNGPIPRMKWLELQLGRLAHCMEWADLDHSVTSAFADDSHNKNNDLEFATLDFGISILLLRATDKELLALQKLPDVFDRLGLYCSRGSLLCALGHDDDFYKQLAKEGESPEDVFRKLGSQPIAAEISPVLNIDQNLTTTFQSKLWGCAIKMTCPATSPYLELAESILAATEATLATAGKERVFAISSHVELNIVPADCTWFKFNADELSNEFACKIECGEFEASNLSRENQGLLQNKICEFVTNLLLRVFHIQDFEATAKKLFGDERGFDRGANLTTSFVTLGNILSHSPRLLLSDWLDGSERLYEIRRNEYWHAFEGAHPAASTPDTPDGSDTSKTKTWAGFGDVHQRHVSTNSLIHAPLWDAAGWVATAFVLTPHDTEAPMLGLGFKDREPASKIFSNWHSEFIEENSSDRLRIIILKGINRANKHAYRICLTSNMEQDENLSEAKYIMVTSRCHTMEPKDDRNLVVFLERLKKWGNYYLIYAVIGNDGQSMEPVLESKIKMSNLVVKDAWQIGIGDPDCMAIQPNDDPIIPKNQPDAPVQKLLQELKRYQK